MTLDELDAVIDGIAPAIAALVKREVASAVAAIPPPVKGEPGKNADPEMVRLVAAETLPDMVERARAMLSEQMHAHAIPAALTAEMATVRADVQAVIAQAVKTAVESLPRPKDGSSVTLDDLRPVVASEVAAAVALIPKPKDGESIEPETVREMVVGALGPELAKLPRPKDGEPGKNADAELVRLVVAELLPEMVERSRAALSQELRADVTPAVAAAVAAIPKPKDGEPVHPDTVALMVARAVREAVAALPRPKDGDAGRDATQYEPLLSIDDTKSYPRGTFAAHRGGMIRSFRQTDPVGDAGLFAAGWAVMLNGIAGETEETADEGRTDKRITRYTDGTVLERSIARSVVIDRGVYREGEAYAKGDGVSWAGSFWIAQKATAAKPDAADGSWRLSVKKGRDKT